MQQLSAHLWRFTLNRAMDETDPALAPAKIDAAEAAIFQRIRGFTRRSFPLEERDLLLALEMIRCLRSQAPSQPPERLHEVLN